MYRISGPTDLYSAGDVLDKTLYALTTVPVYDGVPDGTYKPKQIAHVNSGQPVGVVYSWIDADPTKNRNNIWWMFYADQGLGISDTNKYYYAENVKGYYDANALQAQGVLTVEQQIQQQQEQDKPWYLQLTDKLVPTIAAVVIGAVAITAVVHGVFSKRSNNA